MSSVRTIGRNTIIQFVGKIVGTLMGLLTFGAIERYLGPEGFGQYTFVMAYLGTFSVIADLGLYIIFVRELNKPGADQSRVVGNILALRWTSALIILSLGALVIWRLGVNAAVKESVVLGSLAYVAIAGTQLLVGLYQTKYNMLRVTLAELAGRVVLLGGTWWAISTQAGLRTVIAAVVAGSIVNFFIVWTSAWRYVSLRLRFELGYWKEILRQVFPVTVSVVLNLIYFRADTLLLRMFSTDYYVGLYGAAYKILEILITFPIMFAGLLLPILSSAFNGQDLDRFKKIFQRGFELLLMAAIPIVVGGWVLPEQVLVAIGEQAYAPAAPALQLLIIAVGAAYLNALSAHSVTIIGRQKKMMWSYLAVAVVGLMFYLIAIPRFGMIGAAYGTILTEGLTAIIGYIVVLRALQFRLSLRLLPRILLSVAVMAGVAYVLRDNNFWLTAIMCVVIYSVMLLALRAFPVSALKEIISSRATAQESA